MAENQDPILPSWMSNPLNKGKRPSVEGWEYREFEPDYNPLDPKYRDWSKFPPPADQAAELGATLGRIPVDNAVEFVKGALVGHGMVEKVGDEAQILRMNYDYLNKAAEPDLLKKLNLDQQSKFDTDYKNWFLQEQARRNDSKKAAQLDAKLYSGLGNLQLKKTQLNLVGKNDLQNYAKQLFVDRVKTGWDESSATPDHGNISILTRKEQNDYLGDYITFKAQQANNHLLERLGDLGDQKDQTYQDLTKARTKLNQLQKRADDLQANAKSGQWGSDLTMSEQLTQLRSLKNQISSQQIRVKALEKQQVQISDQAKPLLQDSKRFESLISDAKKYQKDPNSVRGTEFAKLASSLKSQLLPQNSVTKFENWSGVKFSNEFKKFYKDPTGYVTSAPFRLIKYQIWDARLSKRLNLSDRLDDLVRNLLKSESFWAKGSGQILRNSRFILGKGASGAIPRASYLAGEGTFNLIRISSGALGRSLGSLAGRLGSQAMWTAVRSAGGAAIAAAGPWVLAAIGIFIVLILVVLIAFRAASDVSDVQACGAPPQGVVLPKSTEMLQYVFQVAQQNTKGCVPAGLILSLASIEAGSFNYTDQQFKKYSTPGWWGSASAQDLQDGYANNTCDKTYQDPNTGQTLKLCNADVRGVMQFEENTFNFYAKQFPPDITSNHTPDRRNAKDAIYAAALFIRDHSGITDPKDCGANWSQDTINKIAGAYCGNSCNGFQAQCGSDYCGQAYGGYLAYKPLNDCNTGGNQDIVKAIESLSLASYGELDCLLMVDDALASIKYKNWYGYGAASEVFAAGPTEGYQMFSFTLHQIPQPGDLVTWGGGYGGDGHIAVVDHSTTQAGTTYVYVYDNLAQYNGGKPYPYVMAGDELNVAGGFGVGNNAGYLYQGFLRATDKSK